MTKDALYSVEFPLSGASHWSLFHEIQKSPHHNVANAAGERQRTAGTGCQGFHGVTSARDFSLPGNLPPAPSILGLWCSPRDIK